MNSRQLLPKLSSWHFHLFFVAQHVKPVKKLGKNQFTAVCEHFLPGRWPFSTYFRYHLTAQSIDEARDRLELIDELLESLGLEA